MYVCMYDMYVCMYVGMYACQVCNSELYEGMHASTSTCVYVAPSQNSLHHAVLSDHNTHTRTYMPWRIYFCNATQNGFPLAWAPARPVGAPCKGYEELPPGGIQTEDPSLLKLPCHGALPKPHGNP